MRQINPSGIRTVDGMIREKTGMARGSSRVLARIPALLTPLVLLAAGLVVLKGPPAGASVSPSSLNFGDVAWGSQGTPVKTVTLTANHPDGRVKSVSDDPRFRIVASDCVAFQSKTCTISVAPFWPPYGWAPAPGPTTVQFPVVYTYGAPNTETITVSGNLLPPGPTFINPTHGATEVTSARPFTWSTVWGADLYGLWVGTTPGSNDVLDSGELPNTQTSYTVPSLPLAATLHARVATSIGGTWYWTDITFTTAGPTTLTIDDVWVDEVPTGTSVATFTITRSGDTSSTSSVYWATADGSATAPSDYMSQSPVPVTFAPEVSTVPVTVTVKGDMRAECDETLSVSLSSASGATISIGTGTGTILNYNDGSLPDLLSCRQLETP